MNPGGTFSDRFALEKVSLNRFTIEEQELRILPGQKTKTLVLTDETVSSFLIPYEDVPKEMRSGRRFIFTITAWTVNTFTGQLIPLISEGKIVSGKSSK